MKTEDSQRKARPLPAISENIDRGTEKHGNSGGMGLLDY